MSQNFTQDEANFVSLTIAGGGTAGDPVAVGSITGVLVATVTAGAVGLVQIKGVAKLSVKAIDGSGNSAVGQGDAILFVNADNPKLSKKATGTLFGYAIGTVTSGSTATIEVLLK